MASIPTVPINQPEDATADLLSQQGATTVPGGPVKGGLRAVLSGILQNFSYGAGQAMKKQAGLATDQEIAMQNAALAQENAKTQMIDEQRKQMATMVTLPNGWQVPYSVAQKAFPEVIKGQYGIEKQLTANAGSAAVANINQGNGVEVPESVANAIGMPEIAHTKAGKGTWSNINSNLKAQGFKYQDLGQEGVWLVDKFGTKISRLGQSPSIGRANAMAEARAEWSPFETVDDNNNPTTISNATALRTGAPGISRTNLTQVRGKQALIEDIRGGVEQVRQFSNVIDRPGVKVKVAAALADPGLSAQTILQSPIVASMKPDEQQYVINLLNLKENAMAMRSVLGAGQGSEDLRTAITKTIPNAMTPNSSYANAQLDTFLNTLGRLEKGIPQVNKPGAGAAPKATHRFNPATGKIEVINGK